MPLLEFCDNNKKKPATIVRKNQPKSSVKPNNTHTSTHCLAAKLKDMKSDRIASRTWLSNKCVDKRPLYLKLFVFFHY